MNTGQWLFQNGIGRVENIFGEKDAQLSAGLNLALNEIHRFNPRIWAALFEFYLKPASAGSKCAPKCLARSGYFFEVVCSAIQFKSGLPDEEMPCGI
jgi:hypothetical protein